MAKYLQSYILLSLTSVALGQQAPLDANGNACLVVQNINAACERATSGWGRLTDFSSKASCACYYSTAWAPRIYDNYFQSCVTFLATGNPGAFASATATAGPPTTTPCQRVGNVRRVSTTNTISTLPELTVTADPNYQACVTLNNGVANCAARTTGFPTLPWSQQASCLCYSGRAYAPTMYDNLWGSCLRFMSTGNPSAYAAITSAGPITTAPCSAAGDVLDVRTSSRTTTSTTSPTTTSSSSTSTSTSSAPATTSASGNGGSTSSDVLLQDTKILLWFGIILAGAVGLL